MKRFILSSHKSQRGEVAWFLTVISMFVIAVGLVIGVNSTQLNDSVTSQTSAFDIQAGKFHGKPISRTDGQFMSFGGKCQVSFDTQIDPRIVDIIITRPPTKSWPAAGADAFSLVTEGGLTDFYRSTFVKNYQIIVRFRPDDPNKKTPNPRDIEVTYKVPSQADKVYIVDQSRVPEWVQSSDTEVLLIWSYTNPGTDPRNPNAAAFFFTSATSTKCTNTTTTVTPSHTLTPTPSGTTTPRPGVCYDRCSTSADCGRHVDPATGVEQNMLCLDAEYKGGTAPAFFQTDATYTLDTYPNGDYPYKSVAELRVPEGERNDRQEQNGIIRYQDGIKLSHSGQTFNFGSEGGRAYLVWDTGSVPAEFRDKEIDITLSLPANYEYEVAYNYCITRSIDDGCSGWSDYIEQNPEARYSATIPRLGIKKDVFIRYGWVLKRKDAPTPTPDPNDYSYTSVAVLEDADNGFRVADYIYGMNMTNCLSDTYPIVDPATNKAQYKWSTTNVQGSLRDISCNIEIDLPTGYKVVDTFCNDSGTGTDACRTYRAQSNPNPNIIPVRIEKNANVRYGWQIERVAPTAVPPTTTPQPDPIVCSNIRGKVSSNVIDAAVSNPNYVNGWNTRDAQGRIQVYLALRFNNQPYHPIYNPLTFKGACDTTTAPTVTTTPDPSGGHAVCNPSTGRDCRCMPPSCTGRDCRTKPLACDSTTPTVTPEPLSCVYNAIAFVEECENINKSTGECEAIAGTNRLQAKPIQDPELARTNADWKMWAPLNNLQALNPLRSDDARPPGNQKFNFINTDEAGFEPLQRIFKMFTFANNLRHGISISPRVYSEQTINGISKKEVLFPRTDIQIASTEELRRQVEPGTLDVYVPNEQYDNREDSSVKLFFNRDEYRVVPNGKNIYSCTNHIAQELLSEGKLDPIADADFISMTSGTGACNMSEFNNDRYENLDNIDGLTVGCGQDIVYGWTLERCKFNFDYVFVVDTSTTMTYPDPNLGGQRKIDAVMDQIDTFMTNIENSGTDSRVAFINFNNAVHVYDNNGAIKPNAQGIRTNGFLDGTRFAEARAALPQFRQTKDNGGLIEKGTCIKCGLDLANQLIRSRSTAEKEARQPVVIFLTDGLPNAYPGDADPNLRNQYPPEARNNPVPWSYPGIYRSADALRNDGQETTGATTRVPGPNDISDDVLLVTIGYGDESIKQNQGQNFQQLIFAISSDVQDSLERWAYSTDPSNSASGITNIFEQVQDDLNTCSRSAYAYQRTLENRDVNKDGIINTIDLFLIYDNYYVKGEDVAEDVNLDGVVNAYDVSMVIEVLGTVVNTETAQ